MCVCYTQQLLDVHAYPVSNSYKRVAGILTIGINIHTKSQPGISTTSKKRKRVWTIRPRNFATMKNAFMSVILLSVVAAITCAPGSYSHNDERSVQQQKTYFEQLLELLEEKAKNQVRNAFILGLLYYSNIQHTS